MKKNIEGSADNDFQIRVRSIKNGMLVLNNGETTYCKDIDAVRIVIDDAVTGSYFSLTRKNIANAFGKACKKNIEEAE